MVNFFHQNRTRPASLVSPDASYAHCVIWLSSLLEVWSFHPRD